ncbi:sugar phosphate isomerase/epimerase family protein [Rhodococcus globerulus]|uniref:sugar phosphate isomerase/epimerase family protein n=1 Tax=Rhodococcus globerulus TaxID=33008 RepID=UPI001C5A198F|nr:sugar phosphate isomerase/epimerase [Rhodococcus globerulus]QXW04968.1 sugar phosphate isomerase/epimerase [Rhodococcus globerulus]
MGAHARILGGSPVEAISRAQSFGLAVVEFASPFALSPTLAYEELDELTAFAGSRGVEITCALGILSPWNPERMAPFEHFGSGDAVAGIGVALSALARIGVRVSQVVVGTLEDRDENWSPKLDSAAALFTDLRPSLEECGIKLAVKTHEEITSTELLDLVNSVGADVVGIALDPVNFPVRLEDPVLATRRLAHHVLQIHYDDAWVTRTDVGLARRLCPAGFGDIDWPAIWDVLADNSDPVAPVLIDIHRGEFDMPIHDGGWLRDLGDVSQNELASLAALARPDLPAQMDDGIRLAAALAELSPLIVGQNATGLRV